MHHRAEESVKASGALLSPATLSNCLELPLSRRHRWGLETARSTTGESPWVR